MDAQRLERIRVETHRRRRDAEARRGEDDALLYLDGVLEIIYDHRPYGGPSEGMELLLAGVEVGSISELRRLVDAGRDRDAVLHRLDSLEETIRDSLRPDRY